MTFSAYFLHPGAVEDALIAAGKRGAAVHVRLEGRMYRAPDGMTSENLQAVQILKKANVDASLVYGPRGDAPAMHMKAAVCDGEAFLDDRNWNRSNDTVIRDDAPSHVRAIRAAVLGTQPVPARSLALTKADALASESQVVNASRTCADVETEELGYTAVTKALRGLAMRGVRCRLLVSAQGMKNHGDRMRLEAASLQRDGVDVRVAQSNEKLAVADAAFAWIGSTSATNPHFDPDCADWGLRTRNRRVVRVLQQRFAAHWAESKPLA